MKKQKNYKESGITLIALVVTIIVLLLLAGISILMITGQNGIINMAVNAKTKTIEGSAYEKLDIIRNNWEMERKINSEASLDEFLENEKTKRKY